MNERYTEGFVRDHFKNDPMFNIIKFEEQKSTSPLITELLKKASKSNSGKVGRPEFIITFPSINSNYVIIIECKADVSMHQSESLDRPKHYALDGALHYGEILSTEYEVLSIGVSGQTKGELKVSTSLHRQNTKGKDTGNTSLLTINDYLSIFNSDSISESIRNTDIIQKAIWLNTEFQDYSIAEYERCTLVSAILIGLQDNAFKEGYSRYSKSHHLKEQLIAAIKRVLEDKKLKNETSLIKEFNKTGNISLFEQTKIKKKKEKMPRSTLEILKEVIKYIEKKVFPLIVNENSSTDALGKFYTEFIRYAGSAQKQGIVLTPKHLTDFFCDLANLTKDCYVYDPCCGSGGFLISAMKRMLELAKDDNEKKKEIKAKQLIGIERSSAMFAYACTNMMFRGDGKSNIYNKDCLISESAAVTSHHTKINKVFLNPPYDVGNARQMEFVEHGLDIVSKTNGIVIAVVQMSCATRHEKDLIEVKKRLLHKHRLKAVISMPNDLFYPVGVVVSVMVWEANQPNKNFETWFGYLKDDGFEKRKHKGRVDEKNKWDEIKKKFLDAYNNSKEIVGLSVKKEVKVDGEWCAEAYMETDYSKITQKDFVKTMKDYIAFQFLNEKG